MSFSFISTNDLFSVRTKLIPKLGNGRPVVRGTTGSNHFASFKMKMTLAPKCLITTSLLEKDSKKLS